MQELKEKDCSHHDDTTQQHKEDILDVQDGDEIEGVDDDNQGSVESERKRKRKRTTTTTRMRMSPSAEELFVSEIMREIDNRRSDLCPRHVWRKLTREIIATAATAPAATAPAGETTEQEKKATKDVFLSHFSKIIPFQSCCQGCRCRHRLVLSSRRRSKVFIPPPALEFVDCD